MRIGIAILVVTACGPHAQHGDSTGDGAACVMDKQCSSGRCCSNVCVDTADCAFAVTSLTPANGFVDGGDYVTLGGAGFAAGMKVYIGDGRAPVRVVSPTQALVLTPPGPVGVDDVRIELGAVHATLHQAFAYRSAGLELQWEQKPLQVVRGENPALAVMQDGRVLIAGGTTVPDQAAMALDTAEIYNRASDSVMPAANAMQIPRWHNSAVPLLTGKVLVIGGVSSGGAKADLFDPATNTFAPAHDIDVERYETRSVLLPDGRVFVSSSSVGPVSIYDPETDSWTAVANTNAHSAGYVVRLRDGRVLLGGGDGGVTAAEVFDPDTNTFTPAANAMVHGRSMVTAHTLPSGKVAIIAGASQSAGGIIDPLDAVEIYDPVTNTFADAGYHLTTARCWHASALVRDGTILVMGGYTEHASCASSVATVEQIDPVAGTVTPFPTLLNTNTEWTATTLLDGSVLGVGGGACGTTMALPDIDFLKGAPIQ